MTRKLLTVLSMSAVLVLSACHTVAGVGEDVESAGDCVEDVAEGRTC